MSVGDGLCRGVEGGGLFVGWGLVGLEVGRVLALAALGWGGGRGVVCLS